MATGVLLTRRYRGAALDLGVFRRPIVLGLGLVTAALLLLSTLSVDSEYLPIGVALVLLGTGASTANVPRTCCSARSAPTGSVSPQGSTAPARCWARHSATSRSRR
jgi:hypothetical protein